MEEPARPEECEVEVVVPPKKKALKQARLPFSTLSSVESPNTNKKRKLESPTPIECKSPKLVKITTKENSFDISKPEEKDVVTLKEEDNEKASETSKEKNDETVDMDSSNIKTTPKSKPKKPEEKSGAKLGSLTRFLTKTESKDSTKNKSESVNKTAKPDDSMECEIIKSQDEVETDSKKESESVKVSENKVTKEETVKISVEIPEKEETESKDSLPSSKENSQKTESDKDDNSHSEQDPQEMEMSKIESDSESSDDDQETDRKTDVDESEEKKRITEEKLTPTTKKLPNLKQKKMTPKQLEKQIEKQKRDEEKQKQRLEREKKREEERENRKKLKEEKRKEKDEKEKVEREQKKKEKEQKELKKQMENEQKQKEKESKKEDQRKREEEKRKKEEEKLEAERKKQKAASTFVSFFVAKKPTESKTTTEQKTAVTKNFMPFEVKADMRIAPVCRRIISDDEKRTFDEQHEKQSVDKLQLYLAEIKSKNFQTRKSGKTWPPETKDDGDDDVVIIEDDNERNYNVVDRGNMTVEKHRSKLLMFKENRRPPYRGTWRKKSLLITARKPFTKDMKFFDYEVDSDEEWEEEEPGESLHGSDDEKDEDNNEDNEYDVDNDFMVPHGYLSEEEAQAEDDEDMNPETQKFKLKILGEQFEAERKTKTCKLKPKVIGCIWQSSGNTYVSNIHFEVLKLLKDREIWVNEIPINLQSSVENESLHGSDCGTPSRRQNSVGPGAKKTRVPEEAIPDLIRLVHGNINGRGFLVKEFMCFWTKKNDLRVSKVSLSKKIREIARWATCPKEGPMYQKYCWFVNDEVRKKYLGDEDCGLPNRWTYSLTPKKRVEVDLAEKTEKDDNREKDKDKKSVPLITQYTKKFTQEELKKQLAEKSAAKLTPPVNKKRVALISVGRGEKFPKSPRMSLLDKFMVGESSTQNKEIATKKTDNDDDITIIDDDDNKKEESKNTDQEKNLTNGEKSKEKNKVEFEDDCIMISDDSEDEKVSKDVNLGKIKDKNDNPPQIVTNGSEKSDKTQNEDESKMETSE